MSAGVGWPVHWYELGRARGKIFRSRDAGKTWERLLGGLPNGQRALFSALDHRGARRTAIRSMRPTPTARCSRASTAATAGRSSPTCRRCRRRDFYKGLVRDRVKLANVDDIVANPTATKRWQEAGEGAGWVAA